MAPQFEMPAYDYIFDVQVHNSVSSTVAKFQSSKRNNIPDIPLDEKFPARACVMTVWSHRGCQTPDPENGRVLAPASSR